MGEESDALNSNYDDCFDDYDDYKNHQRTKNTIKKRSSTKQTIRGKTSTYSCKHCGCNFQARIADRKRGWAKFCSKSCKASHQDVKQHGHYRNQYGR